MPEPVQNLEKELALMTILKDINVEIFVEVAACKEIVAWIGKYGVNPQGALNGFKMYKNFCLESGILIYVSHLSNFSPIEVLTMSNISDNLSKFHSNIGIGCLVCEGT